MESIITFVDQSELSLYNECIKSQQKWAKFHGMEHKIVLYSVKKKQNKHWEFYCNFIDYVNSQESGTFVGILPSVMVLNKYTNPINLDVFKSDSIDSSEQKTTDVVSVYSKLTSSKKERSIFCKSSIGRVTIALFDNSNISSVFFKNFRNLRLKNYSFMMFLMIIMLFILKYKISQ